MIFITAYPDTGMRLVSNDYDYSRKKSLFADISPSCGGLQPSCTQSKAMQLWVDVRKATSGQICPWTGAQTLDYGFEAMVPTTIWPGTPIEYDTSGIGSRFDACANDFPFEMDGAGLGHCSSSLLQERQYGCYAEHHTMKATTPIAIVTPNTITTPAESAMTPMTSLEQEDFLAPKLSSRRDQSEDSGNSISRLQSHTIEEWENIRPIFERLYLRRKLTLRDVKEKLQKFYNFRATTPMFKKKIKLWGLKKYGKRATGANMAARADVVHSKPALRRKQGLEIRTAKSTCHYTNGISTRHTADETKASSKDGAQTSPRQVQNDRAAHPVANGWPGWSEARAISTPSSGIQKETEFMPSWELSQPADDCAKGFGYLSACIKPPSDLLQKERLFRVLREVTEGSIAQFDYDPSFRNETEQLCLVLDEGLVSHKVNNHDRWLECFNEAGLIVNKWLCAQKVPTLTLLYYMIPEAWNGALPVLKGFTDYVAKAIVEKLGAKHPLTFILRCLQELPRSTCRGLKVWDCIAEHLILSKGNCGQWTDVMLYRLRYCKRNNRPDLAVVHCRNAISDLERADLLAGPLKLDLEFDLGEALLSNDQAEQAIAAFQKSKSFAQTDTSQNRLYIVLALHRLATIYEREQDDLLQAYNHYAEAFHTSLALFGIDSSETMHLLREYLRFCERRKSELEDNRIFNGSLGTHRDFGKIVVGCDQYELDVEGNVVQTSLYEDRTSYPRIFVHADGTASQSMRNFHTPCGLHDLFTTPL